MTKHDLDRAASAEWSRQPELGECLLCEQRGQVPSVDPLVTISQLELSPNKADRQLLTSAGRLHSNNGRALH